MALAKRVRATGRVQGVFFRAWTKQEAEALGLAGWVRNCDDGSVEAHVEGEDSAVDRLVERLGQGPPGASVNDLRIEDAEALGLSSFEVRD